MNPQLFTATVRPDTPVNEVVSRWHDHESGHPGAFKLCDQQPCAAVRVATEDTDSYFYQLERVVRECANRAEQTLRHRHLGADQYRSVLEKVWDKLDSTLAE